MADPAYLTKSRYAAGLQCLRRLWLGVHERVDWESAEPGSAEDIGLELGRPEENASFGQRREGRGSNPRPSA